MEQYLPESQERAEAVRLDAQLYHLTNQIDNVTNMLDALAENPVEVPQYELYRGHLHDRLATLADAWGRLNASREHLLEAVRLAGMQEIGEA